MGPKWLEEIITLHKCEISFIKILDDFEGKRHSIQNNKGGEWDWDIVRIRHW